jgi:dipeptidyl aminopeptidase/acylaminoacyl peptidase
MHLRRIFLSAIALSLLAVGAWSTHAQTGYQRPPKAITDILDAPAPVAVSLSPTRDRMVLTEVASLPSISELAEPMLRLAGTRVNPNTNGPHRAPRFTGFRVKNVADGKETRLVLPAGAQLGGPLWTPDGKQFAFANTVANGIELWVWSERTGIARRVPGIRLNAAYGSAFRWMPDNHTLLCRTVYAGRGPAPAPAKVPTGPTIQENFGKATGAATFQDLLKNKYDEALFDYYMTSQLVLVDTRAGTTTRLGKPAIYDETEPSPDGKHILISQNHRPYSYLLTSFAFPRDVEIWDQTGRLIQKIASIPLQDQIPLDGVSASPRGHQWRPTEPATLVWTEALDGGDTRKKAPFRDRVMFLRAPFRGEATELTRTENRFGGMMWGEKDGLVLVRDSDRSRRWTRTFVVNADRPGQSARVVWDRSSQDRYNDPGQPIMRVLPSGHRALLQNGSAIYLTGQGSTPQGDRPFLDRLDLATLKTERIFRCDDQSYESVTALLDDQASRFVTRRETPTDPPNYFIRKAGQDQKTALTNFTDPAPQLRGIRKELVKYKRADGVDLSFTLYLPPGYKTGTRLPTLVWAYPLEFSDAGTAGQVSGSANRFTSIGGASHLFLLLAGYAVLDDATMPVIGDSETMNNTYVEQIVASAQAAIDKAVAMGVTDRNRVGVGGHSYGAFMTANLLAHSDIFRAGIARSGAYNRTLTPFGFQSERRTFWDAPEMYSKVSPFMFANKLKEPILLIHGEADNNAGTHPIQSDRFYQALRGNGGNVRYVTLPLEAHGYGARESIEHTLWEMVTWMDKFVKNASEPAAAASSSAR